MKSRKNLHALVQCQPFECRVRQSHTADLGNSLSSILFQRLSQSKKAWLENHESSWECGRCKVENKLTKKRCFVCQSWRGGRHPQKKVGKPRLGEMNGPDNEHNATESFLEMEPRSTGLEKPTTGVNRCAVRNTEPTLAVSESAVTITEGSSPGTVKVWECYVCFEINHWRKYFCSRCGRRAGGRALDVPFTSDMETYASVYPAHSAATASPSSICATSSHKRKKSSESTFSDDWTCHRCASSNRSSSRLCTECFSSRKRRSSAG